MRTPKATYLFLWFLFWLSNLSYSQDLFDSIRTREYADYLYQSGSYSEAIDEYERFVDQFFAGEKSRYRLVNSYRRAGLHDKAMLRINELWDNPTTVSPLIAKEFFALKIINTGTDNLLESINGNTVLSDTEKMFFSSAYLLINDEYNKAHSILNKNIYPGNAALTSFRQFAVEGMILPRKSPLLSAALSAVIPGTGKFYTGQWQDGIMALVMVGTSAWQSYRAFSHSGIKSPYGWVFGTVGAVFYISNITGSIKSANRFNKINKERIRIRVQEVFINNI
ncbi:MAG: hypothetical protein R6U58_10945 [Bacteroidales bacterium]